MLETQTLPLKTWEPFFVVAYPDRGAPPRSIDLLEGVADRMRAAAFAEIQAKEAFLWAAETFQDASADLKKAWQNLARAEDKHLNWLLIRMQELGIDVKERPVSDQLWQSFQNCKTAKQFCVFMANAEERGRKAGERFYENLKTRDRVTAEIFRKIAEEEVEHIQLVQKFFPEETLTQKKM